MPVPFEVDCCDFEELVGQRMPFRHVVALEFGAAGLLSGLVQCKCREHCFTFQQFDDFDFRTHTVRAYGLHRATAGQFNQLVGLYSKIAKPRWPVWIPPIPEQISKSVLVQIEGLEQSLFKHGRFDIVVASDNIINSLVMGFAREKHNGDRWLSAMGF